MYAGFSSRQDDEKNLFIDPSESILAMIKEKGSIFIRNETFSLKAYTVVFVWKVMLN